MQWLVSCWFFFKFVTFLLICCWTSSMFLKRYGLKLGESIGLVRFMWWLERSCDISWNDWTTRIPTHCGDLWCCDYGLRKGQKMAACFGVLWNHELLWICFRYGYHWISFIFIFQRCIFCIPCNAICSNLFPAGQSINPRPCKNSTEYNHLCCNHQCLWKGWKMATLTESFHYHASHLGRWVMVPRWETGQPKRLGHIIHQDIERKT